MTNPPFSTRRLGEKALYLLEFPDRSRLSVLPFGGRVLGLHAGADPANFFWTHPALDEATKANTFLAKPGWPNSGGERTWLAPEIDFFFPEYPDLTTYTPQPGLDPGDFTCEASAEGMRWAMTFTVTPSRTKVPLHLHLAKSIRPTSDPLAGRIPEGVLHAGYETETVLEFAGLERYPVGIWTLLQLPSGGRMIIPTRHSAKPHVVFGDIPEGHLRICDDQIRYDMMNCGAQKISVRATDTTGRAGYLYAREGFMELVVKNFPIDPAGNYVEADWHDPSDTGYAMQACHVDNELGCFSELEHHSVALLPDQARLAEISQVWAYRGPRADILQIASTLLGVDCGGEDA